MLRFVLTCEHGGNIVPAAYAAAFAGKEDLLDSHQGYDIGALELFHALDDLADKSFYAETTRLLVELNRSLHNKKLFSSITRSFPDKAKSQILKEHYFSYRDNVEQLVEDLIRAGRRVLHIAVHTFTPVLKGEERQADVGLLYDPKRKSEQAFCRAWKQALYQLNPKLLVRYNYPYLGIADGFPTYLRRKFTEHEYMGIELEVNQKFATEDGQYWQGVKENIRISLQQVLTQYRPEAEDI